MFWWHKYSFSLDFKHQNEFYKQHSMSGYFSPTCGLDMSPYEPILLKQYFLWEFFFMKCKKKTLPYKELTSLLCKNFRSEFSKHQEVPLECGKLWPKVFASYICHFFIQECFFFVFFMLQFFRQNSHLLYVCTKFWFVLKHFHEYFERRKWGDI